MLACHFEPWAIMADITEVRHCLLSEIATHEVEVEEFGAPEDLFRVLRRNNPGFHLASRITIIRWDNIRGSLVESAKKSANGRAS